MPRLPKIKASEAERLLFAAGFALIRSQGSHRIYRKETVRVVVPFHAGKMLHRKIIKQVLQAIAASEEDNNLAREGDRSDTSFDSATPGEGKFYDPLYLDVETNDTTVTEETTKEEEGRKEDS